LVVVLLLLLLLLLVVVVLLPPAAVFEGCGDLVAAATLGAGDFSCAEAFLAGVGLAAAATAVTGAEDEDEAAAVVVDPPPKNAAAPPTICIKRKNCIGKKHCSGVKHFYWWVCFVHTSFLFLLSDLVAAPNMGSKGGGTGSADFTTIGDAANTRADFLGDGDFFVDSAVDDSATTSPIGRLRESVSGAGTGDVIVAEATSFVDFSRFLKDRTKRQRYIQLTKTLNLYFLHVIFHQLSAIPLPLLFDFFVAIDNTQVIILYHAFYKQQTQLSYQVWQ
jgi:hypothetical protein